MVKVPVGGKVPVSGQYKPTKGGTEATFVQGKKVPPTPNGSTGWVLVDKTKHKNYPI